MTTLEKLREIERGEAVVLDAADAKNILRLTQSARSLSEAHWGGLEHAFQRSRVRTLEHDLETMGEVLP